MALKNILNVSSVFVINFLKIEMKKMKPSIKIIRNYLKLLKRNHSPILILVFKSNIKKTWKIIKYSIRKGKSNNENVPQKVIVDNIGTGNETQIAENFLQSFLQNLVQNVPKKLKQKKLKFDDYLENCDTIQPDSLVSTNELIFCLQINKIPSHDGISFNEVKHCFGSLHKPLFRIFWLYKFEKCFSK